MFGIQRLTCLLVLALLSCDSNSAVRETPSQASPSRRARPTAKTEPAAVTEKDPFIKDAELLTRNLEMKLKSELVAAMKQGGPAAAIKICSQRAQAIASETSTDELTVRRIGTRLRNPKNQPDPHDERALRVLSPDAPTYHSDKPQRYYRAIFAKPLCLTCHGQPSQLAPGAQDLLAKLYPQDRAVGYAEGDLRGAFVVQKASATQTP